MTICHQAGTSRRQKIETLLQFVTQSLYGTNCILHSNGNMYIKLSFVSRCFYFNNNFCIFRDSSSEFLKRLTSYFVHYTSIDIFKVLIHVMFLMNIYFLEKLIQTKGN